jgi:hypothetical protein
LTPAPPPSLYTKSWPNPTPPSFLHSNRRRHHLCLLQNPPRAPSTSTTRHGRRRAHLSRGTEPPRFPLRPGLLHGAGHARRQPPKLFHDVVVYLGPRPPSFAAVVPVPFISSPTTLCKHTILLLLFPARFLPCYIENEFVGDATDTAVFPVDAPRRYLAR